ncbi:MAG: cytochrome c biogenesis protein CcsA [Bacteroidota bacterium]
MQYEGEHLWIGKLGHLFVLIAFTASLLSTIAYFQAAKKDGLAERLSWLRFGRVSFIVQVASVVIVFSSIFYMCANHYIEYLFAYKHTSKELEFKYLFASIWEDQSGSFLLWSLWHCVLGLFLIKTSKQWEAPVMSVVSLVQLFLAMMIMGIYIFGTKIGNSPFVLTRNEIEGPIFSMPNYLSMIKDGVGLNVLLRNYWMVIHPPVLFLGFASTLVPFAFAVAGLATKKYGDWVKPAIPWTLFSACVLGVGIMMGGKWAYESLSFGGYWAWDPVENASMVPWLILIAGLHTMVVYKATGHSLKASYVFAILTFIFILYSTFLTRTGVLGDTSVHAFAESGRPMFNLIRGFLAVFAIPSLGLFFVNYNKIPTEHREENTNSREFWMFIGSLVLFLSGMFIIFKTSTPVFNAIFNTKLAPPEDIEFSYNKVMVLIGIIIGILTAITQYFKYKSTPAGQTIKKLAIPTVIAAGITTLLVVFYPITYYKGGQAFLIAIYLALFACIYAIAGNAHYIWKGLNGKFKAAGGSVAHMGFALMIAGMLISSGNKKVISEERFKDFVIEMGVDPLTKKQDNPAENINLVRHVPKKMGAYDVTYLNDSTGTESGRRFYHLAFERKEEGTGKVKEAFTLSPDVYLMKDNNMSSNPDTKNYLTHDVFTYISYALNPDANKDTAQFKISEVAEGDTIYYSKGIIVLNSVEKNPASNKFKINPSGPAVLANLTVTAKDSSRYNASPMIIVDSLGINQVDDTVYAQNLYVKFAGVSSDQTKLKIGIKESDTMIDFVTLKAYIFPYINLVWIGLIVMAVGLVMSMIRRLNLSTPAGILVMVLTAVSMFYMFLLAN